MKDEADYKAMRNQIDNIGEDDIAELDKPTYIVEAGGINEKSGSGAVARFTKKWLRGHVEAFKRLAGLDLDTLDLSADNAIVAENVGAVCGTVKFITSILATVTDNGVWHPEKGPRATGPKSRADQMVMSHAPALLAALRDMSLILARVLATGDTNIKLEDELEKTMLMVANLSRNVYESTKSTMASEQLVEALAEILGIDPDEFKVKTGSNVVVPVNPFNGNDAVKHKA